MEFKYEIITDPQDVAKVCNAIDQHEKFALDFETTGLEYKQAGIHGVALAISSMSWYLCLGAEKEFMSKLGSLAKDKLLIMHNAGFDLHFSNRYKIDPPKIYDTMIGQALVDENQSVALKNLARTKLGIVDDLPQFKDLLNLAKKLTGKRKLEDVTIFDVPLHTLGEYAARDARLTYDLEPITTYEMEQEGMTDLFWDTEMPFVKLLVEMEDRGFYIDQSALNELERELEAERDKYYNMWMEISGGVNPNSTQQLAEYLFKKMKYKSDRKTSTGRQSTDIVALNRIKSQEKHGEVTALIELRTYEKLISTYVTTFRDSLFNGRLHGNFNQTGTVTWRLSSSGPNLQNIPARGDLGKKIRQLFTAPPGMKFICIDYSQLELRILAHYTKDPRMVEVFEKELDPHQMTADLIGIERRYAKNVNFGWAYGVGPKGLCDLIERTGAPRPSYKEAAEWLDGFSKAYPVAENWKNRVINYARELGYVRTIGGHKRRLPDIKSPIDSLRNYAERQAVNSIIQGSAGDIMKVAMLNIAPIQREFATYNNGQVHDEITWEAPEDIAHEFANKASQTMIAAGEFYELRTQLIAEPGVGDNWGDAK